MKKFLLLALAAALAFFTPSCKLKKAGQIEQTINIAIQPSAAFIPLYIARYRGSIEKALRPMNVNVVWQDFESGPPITQSLAAQTSDIGVIGDVPSVTALSTGKMKAVGVPARGPDAYAMLCRSNNNSFNSSADMKGKRIATVFGSTGHNFTKKLLEKNGLKFDDIEFISVSAEETEKALAADLCDAIVIWEPNITRLTDRAAAKVVARGSETDLRGTNAFVVRSDYLDAHRDVVRIILEQYQIAAQDISNLDKPTMKKLSDALKITPEQAMRIAKIYDFSVAASSSDIAALQDTASFLVKIGNLDSVFDVSAKVENLLAEK